MSASDAADDCPSQTGRARRPPANVAAVTRRSILFACVLAATLAMSSALSACATFNRADAVATVNGKDLSRAELTEALKNRIVQEQITSETDEGRSTQQQAGTIISIFIVLNAVEQAGAVDMTGASQQAALEKRYPDVFKASTPEIQRLLVQYTAFAEETSKSTVERSKLLAAVQAADVHVDSRYGYWDPASASVRPFGST